MVKLIDIAEKAKVSLATASLALNDSSLINEKTRDKVKRIAIELNYYPSVYAKRLAQKKNYNISILINSEYYFDYSKIFYLRVIGGIIKEADIRNYAINFAFFNEKKSKNENILTFGKYTSKNTDGILILDIINKDILYELISVTDVPIVLIDNHKKHRNVYAVDNDDFGGAYKATKYLIEIGHKNIGYIGIPNKHPLGKECWKGFKKALDEANLVETIAYNNCDFKISGGKEAANNLLNEERKKLDKTTGLFCINDNTVFGMMEVFKSNGILIPRDKSLIGMDDMEFSADTSPSLTTIKIFMEELGKVGIKKLVKLINKNYSGEFKTIIDNEIIIRESVRAI